VTTFLLSLLSVAALAAEPEAALRPLDGESVKGRLIELSASKVTLETSAGRQQVDSSKLMWVELSPTTAAATVTTWIELLDGSRLHASGYTAAEGKARIELATGQSIEIPTRSIHTVRFQQQSPELAVQWREITSSMAAGDVIVIRKTSMRTVEQGANEPRTITEQALDQHEGTLLDVTPTSVAFQLDGERIPIPRQKLEGLVYFHPAKAQFSPPLARLIDTAGSTWLVRDLAFADGQLTATSLGNVSFQLPIAAIGKIDFSVGNVAFLSDLEADSGTGELSLSLQPAAMTYKFSRMFQVRSRPPLGADGFRIGGQRFENGVSLHSPAKLVYRVPDGFRWFYAVAGVDDSVVAPGRFDLVVLGDGKELARHSFKVDQKREPIPLALDVKAIRRLSIVLEPAGGQDIGDQLDLCEARFTK
jgi:NPCBM/NEW2 domain-containing protein